VSGRDELEAYYDGELRGLARWRMERRLRGSPSLRAELEQLRALGEEVREQQRAAASPGRPRPADLWGALEGSLTAIDAQVAAEQGGSTSRRPARPSPGFFQALRRPAALGALAASALALLIVLRSSPVEGPASEVTEAPSSAVVGGGNVRFLDTAGAPVLVLDQADDVTVIWLVDS